MKKTNLEIPQRILNFITEEVPEQFELNIRDLRFARAMFLLIKQGKREISSKNIKPWLKAILENERLGENYIISLLKTNKTLSN